MLYVPAIGSNKKAQILKDGCRKYETYRNVCFFKFGVLITLICNIYNMSGRVVSVVYLIQHGRECYK